MKQFWFRRFLPTVLLIGVILFLYINLSYTTTTYVTGLNFNLLIYEDSGLGFQGQGRYVLLAPTSGDLNSSTNNLWIYDGGGTFRFLSNETLTLKITYDVSNVRVKGDKGNELRLIGSGSSISIDSGDTVIIQWATELNPWLPIMFIFGMFGICSTIGGAIYAVQQIKKHNYDKGFTMGVIWVSLGVCLVLAWLWG